MQDLHLQPRFERVGEREAAGEKAVQHDTQSPDVLSGVGKIGRAAIREKQFRGCVRKRTLLVDMSGLRGRGAADGCRIAVAEKVAGEVGCFVTQ